MATKNAPAKGLKGTARKFLKAKIGPLPAPVVAVGAVVGVYLLHKRSQANAAAAGATDQGSTAAGAADPGAGVAGGAGSGGSGGSGGSTGPGATPITSIVRNRFVKNVHNTRTVKGNVYNRRFVTRGGGNINITNRNTRNVHRQTVNMATGQHRPAGPPRLPGRPYRPPVRRLPAVTGARR